MPQSIEITDVSVATPTGRALFDGLNLSLGKEHVALVGRNGVGKSTLLALLAGELTAVKGRIEVRGKVHYVAPAEEVIEPLSRGESRRQALAAARASEADILLLDEPTLHLDDDAVAWLRGWLATWPGAVLVASHDRRLLADFRHFFVLSEAGGQYFGGALDALDTYLEREHQAQQQRYLRNLNRLAEHEAHVEQIARRKARKKRSGRCRELDRATPRIRLNQKRADAQVSHGRLAKLREARLLALRRWTQATRRALNVSLSLELPLPELPPASSLPVIWLQDVGHDCARRTLFDAIDLKLARERIAVVGPNGAGKTTLLEIMLGQRRPQRGIARSDLARIGYIEQGGKNWLLDESLRAHLSHLGIGSEASAQLLLAHRFPLALAERSLSSLSPGERARAALIALFARRPTVELLVLDEPTFGLDLLGQRALTRALKNWPGGLVVTSHDSAFLAELGVERTLSLGHQLTPKPNATPPGPPQSTG
jgi:ATPase subunit of ABC transporter with duplicated ATPase domains